MWPDTDAQPQLRATLARRHSLPRALRRCCEVSTSLHFARVLHDVLDLLSACIANDIHQDVAQLVAHGAAHAASGVGSQDDIGQPKQAVIMWDRFVGEYIKPGTGNALYLERGNERLFIDDSSSGHVDEVSRGLHRIELLLANEVMRV